MYLSIGTEGQKRGCHRRGIARIAPPRRAKIAGIEMLMSSHYSIFERWQNNRCIADLQFLALLAVPAILAIYSAPVFMQFEVNQRLYPAINVHISTVFHRI
jgi:hypothetical protein